MKKSMKQTLTTTATTLGMGLTSLCYGGIENIEKGPYKITIDEQGKFGNKNYQYSFKIIKDNEEILGKSSESYIHGWILNKNAIRYNESTDALWVVYEEALDGLDPRTIHLVKLSGNIKEEAIGSFNPMEKASSLTLDTVPEGWNTQEIENIFKQIIGTGGEKEIIISTDKNNIDFEKFDLQSETSSPKSLGDEETPQKDNEINNNQGPSSSTSKKAKPQKNTEHSIEW
jgi:hypothetical protein